MVANLGITPKSGDTAGGDQRSSTSCCSLCCYCMAKYPLYVTSAQSTTLDALYIIRCLVNVNSTFDLLRMTWRKTKWVKCSFSMRSLNLFSIFRVLNTRGGSPVNFQIFFPPLRTLLRSPRLLVLAKGVKSPILFLCIKDRRQYLSRVLRILAIVWEGAIAWRRWFKKILLHCICILRLVFISEQIIFLF